MNELIIKTQQELDSIDKNFNGYIYIEGGTYNNPLILKVKFDHAYVVTRGIAVIEMRESSQVNVMWESSQVNVMRGSSQVNVMRGSSQVKEMWGSSQVKEMWESSQVKEMWESSQVNVMRGSSQVKEMWESSQVKEMWESSQVNVMRGSSQVKEMWGSSQVKEMWESSQVNVMWGSSQVKEMWESSQVNVMWGEAMVSAYGTQKITCRGYNVVRTRKSNQDKLTIIINDTSHLIIIPDFQPTFEDYSKRYPVKVVGETAILYKAVHKKSKGEYFSNYNKEFKYSIGNTFTETVDKNINNSCSGGLHVSHKSWALKFGCDWNDFAILECEVKVDSIFVSTDCDGKVRTSKLKVLRELPKEEYYTSETID